MTPAEQMRSIAEHARTLAMAHSDDVGPMWAIASQMDTFAEALEQPGEVHPYILGVFDKVFDTPPRPAQE